MIKKHSDDPMPVYFKLQTEIKKQIEEGRWAPGESIPTERELSKTYELSSGTVKKSLLNLVNEGYLYRIQGKGTFVAGTTIRRGSLRYYRLQKDFRDEEILLTVTLIKLNRKKGIPKYNNYLQISSNQNLYEMKRLFVFKDKPVLYCVSYLPCNMFPGLEKYKDDFCGEITLYQLLEKEYGITTVSNKKLLSTIAVDKEKAAFLNVPEGKHLLFIEMMSFTYQNKPYEYRKTYLPTDDQKLVVLI
ncbi:MAG: GntR family transcriptional regulator [Deltaproteobacteria bacterium]|nr:GntR family transcriptional regulator [Deltaproteobacteria bacterium]